ncbi:MAG: hypothetical protein CMH53_03160, partial [Myxococcales bacterium]|nr:hypothetical protein [Myxococcales bacterium]
MSRRFPSLQSFVRSALCVSLVVALFAPPAAAKSPIKRMPTYRGEAGELLDDPAKMGQETRAFESAYKAFKLAAREYRGEVRELITGEIDRRKQTVSDTYQTQIDKIMGQQDKLRKEAIARLESFIFRHRGHPRYTPDAVFRLAELYYEDSKATAAYSQDHFEELECMYKRGKLLDPPVEEDANYARSIALYKYLHWVPPGTRMPVLAGKLKGIVLPRRWPNYRHADAALYLQGFCEQEMGDTDRAIATYSSVAKHYPKSRYISEAWLRVGEIYFDESEFEQAADAYRRAAEHAKKTNDAKFYELALYKLGWAYFQMYRYPEAVGWFQKLIEFSDAKSDKKKKGMDLRREAIEYLAKSLAEPSWDDDGCEDFGGPDAKGDCPQLDPRLRPLLYVSGVIKPDTTQFGQWQSSFEGDVLNNLQKNLQARAQVRQQLMVGKPYVREVLTVYAKTLVDFTETEQYRQALMVLRYIVDTWPLDRDAQKLQRLIIDLVSVLTQGMGVLEEEVAANPNKQEALLELSLARKAQIAAINERKKYLRMFSPGSPWHEKWGADKDLARQVEAYSAKLRLEFARLTLQTAQTLKAAGKTEEALVKYREAAVEYEKLLAADPNGDGAYDHLWQLAEIYFYAGEKCAALKNANGDLLLIPKGPMKGELVPWPANKIDEIKKACGTMGKSLPLYERLRSWKGAKPKDSEGKVVDRTVDAAQSSIMVQERLIQARAAYPAADPERLESRLLPSIRPDSERDLETVEKNNKELQASKGQKTNFAIPRQDFPEVVVRWVHAVDRYLAGKFKVAEDPNRDGKYALQAAELLYKNRNFDPWKE